MRTSSCSTKWWRLRLLSHKESLFVWDTLTRNSDWELKKKKTISKTIIAASVAGQDWKFKSITFPSNFTFKMICFFIRSCHTSTTRDSQLCEPLQERNPVVKTKMAKSKKKLLWLLSSLPVFGLLGSVPTC